VQERLEKIESLFYSGKTFPLSEEIRHKETQATIVILKLVCVLKALSGEC